MSSCKISVKEKMPKFETRNALFGYLGSFGLEFEKNIVIFEISTLEFVSLQNFGKNKNV